MPHPRSITVRPENSSYALSTVYSSRDARCAPVGYCSSSALGSVKTAMSCSAARQRLPREVVKLRSWKGAFVKCTRPLVRGNGPANNRAAQRGPSDYHLHTCMQLLQFHDCSFQVCCVAGLSGHRRAVVHLAIDIADRREGSSASIHGQRSERAITAGTRFTKESALQG